MLRTKFLKSILMMFSYEFRVPTDEQEITFKELLGILKSGAGLFGKLRLLSAFFLRILFGLFELFLDFEYVSEPLSIGDFGIAVHDFPEVIGNKYL